MRVFLIKDNHVDSWVTNTSIWDRAFATPEAARTAIGAKHEYWRGNDKPIEPYFTILPVDVES